MNNNERALLSVAGVDIRRETSMYDGTPIYVLVINLPVRLEHYDRDGGETPAERLGLRLTEEFERRGLPVVRGSNWDGEYYALFFPQDSTDLETLKAVAAELTGRSPEEIPVVPKNSPFPAPRVIDTTTTPAPGETADRQITRC